MQTRTSRNAGKLRHMIIVAFFLFFKEYILKMRLQKLRKMKSSDDDNYARGKHPNDDERQQKQADPSPGAQGKEETCLAAGPPGGGMSKESSSA